MVSVFATMWWSYWKVEWYDDACEMSLDDDLKKYIQGWWYDGLPCTVRCVSCFWWPNNYGCPCDGLHTCLEIA